MIQVRGDDLSKYKVLNPAGGGCVDSQYRAYSYIEPEYFYYSKYPGLGYSGLVEKCAGWCLQNGPPKNMIGFETYTKKYVEDALDDDTSDNHIKCECQFEGNRPNPLPTYNPDVDSDGDRAGTGPMKASDDFVYLCYALKSSGGSKASKNAKSSSPHAKSAKVGKRG